MEAQEKTKCLRLSSAPSWLRANASECLCDQNAQMEEINERAPCSDPCCTRYKYFDGVRRWAFTHGTSGKREWQPFAINDGMLVIDPLAESEVGKTKENLVGLLSAPSSTPPLPLSVGRVAIGLVRGRMRQSSSASLVARASTAQTTESRCCACTFSARATTRPLHGT